MNLINNIGAYFPGLRRMANLINQITEYRLQVIGSSIQFVDV